MKTDKLILGILVGAAVGAVAGVLFAPDNGKNTRKKIKDKGLDYADELKDTFDVALDTISKKYESILKDGENYFAKEKSKIKDAKNAISNFNN